VIDFDREQVMVTGWDGVTATVQRGANGTDPAIHAAGTVGIVAPTFGRQTVFDAVGDNIVDLYPSVWGIGFAEINVAWPVTDVPADVALITGFRGTAGANYFTADVRYVASFPASATGHGAVIDAPNGTPGVLTYRARFIKPTDEDADLEVDHRIRPEWERIIVVGAAAQLLSGRDVEAITQEFITEQLQTESLPVSTPGRMSARLTALHEHYLERASRRMQADDRKQIRRRPVARSAIR
jgi:hypothetical protein